ncbi:hypothetical protein [Listeria floridensis]|nr:hypothetical protein [Listeria floridensis]
MEESFDFGHFLKKAFVAVASISLIFIGFIALLTLIGVILAIPLLRKGCTMLFDKEEKSGGRKLKWKTPEYEAKVKFSDRDLLDEKS